jgi:hypothetical protein
LLRRAVADARTAVADLYSREAGLEELAAVHN